MLLCQRLSNLVKVVAGFSAAHHCAIYESESADDVSYYAADDDGDNSLLFCYYYYIIVIIIANGMETMYVTPLTRILAASS